VSDRAYLDHASTSTLRPEALAAVVGWLERSARGEVGDPGRLHAEGLTARVAVETAREQVAALVGARPREVVFCSGFTEAVAALCWGAAQDRGPHSVLSAVEHSAVREWAARGPAAVVGVDRRGRVDAAELTAEIRDDTGLVHLQWANHEVGTLQPVAEVAAAARARGVLVHTDATQSLGKDPALRFDSSGVDLMTVSAHELGGPTGVGALVVRRGVRLTPLVVGGDQERARRAGVEDVAAIVGFGAAAGAVADRLADEAARFARLTERVVAWAGSAEGVEVLGDPVDRLPHLVCLGLEGVEPQPVLIGLDRAGVAVHSGSSCSSEALEPSPVLAAMGVDAERSLRVSVGWSSTDADVDRLLDALPHVLGELRALRRG